MSYQQQIFQPQQYQVMKKPEDDFKGGFNPLYIWPIVSLFLTYGYIVVFCLSTNYFRNTYLQYGLSKLQGAALFFPLVITIANTVIAILCYNKTDRRFFLGASLIYKYGLIPYFIVGGLLIAIFFLLIFTPVVIMIFVSPPIIITLSIIGWVSLSESAPFMIVYFIKAAKEGVVPGKKLHTTGNIVYAVLGCVMQMFFCLDVAAAVAACFKEKRHVKLTIVVLALPVVIFGVSMAIIIGVSLIKNGTSG